MHRRERNIEMPGCETKYLTEKVNEHFHSMEDANKNLNEN